jgi:hypothetical protein
MNKFWILIIFVIVLTACTASQTETSVPPTPTPNPNTENALIAFCYYAVEGNVEKAQELVTEDIEIIFTGDADGGYEDRYEGYGGVEELLNDFAAWDVYDCTVRRFEYNGDEVNLWWTHYSHCIGVKCTASCIFNGTMQGDKIHKIDNNCVHEFWPKDTN